MTTLALSQGLSQVRHLADNPTELLPAPRAGRLGKLGLVSLVSRLSNRFQKNGKIFRKLPIPLSMYSHMLVLH